MKYETDITPQDIRATWKQIGAVVFGETLNKFNWIATLEREYVVIDCGAYAEFYS